MTSPISSAEEFRAEARAADEIEAAQLRLIESERRAEAAQTATGNTASRATATGQSFGRTPVAC